MNRYGGEVLSVGWVFIPSNNLVSRVLRQERPQSFMGGLWYPPNPPCSGTHPTEVVTDLNHFAKSWGSGHFMVRSIP